MASRRHTPERKSRSGPSKAPHLRPANQGRRQLSVWLSDAATGHLGAIARGRSCSAREVLESLILDTPLPLTEDEEREAERGDRERDREWDEDLRDRR